MRWKVTREETKRSRRDRRCMSLPYTLIKQPRAAHVAQTQINLDAQKDRRARRLIAALKKTKRKHQQSTLSQQGGGGRATAAKREVLMDISGERECLEEDGRDRGHG